MIEALCFALLLVNVVQFLWWSRQVQALVDKVMSRNYAEYVASKEYRPAEVIRPPTLSDAQEDQDDQAAEINRRFGM